MALISKLDAIGEATRALTGKTGKMTLEQIAANINGYEPPAPSYDTPSITVSSGGIITASANGKSNTQQLTTQAAKTVTPTKSSQTAVASGRYTTGAVTVGAIPSEYIVPSGSQTLTENDTYDVASLASVVVNVAGGGGGLPSGFKAIAMGTHTLSSAVTGSGTFTVTHNLGETPDMFLFYAPQNIATTYSMLYAFRSTKFGYRSTSYLNLCGYHGNSTTTVTATNVTTSYGVKTLSSTSATITSYSTSTSYGWRAGKYEWIAIKFS